MLQNITEILSLDFMQRGFAGGILISLCCALLGVILVLKRYSMIGDGLSHVGFGALAIGTAAGVAPLYVAIPIVIITAFLLLRMQSNGKLKGDAAIALISTFSLAFGVLLISITPGANTDIYSYMFGSILAITPNDIILILLLALTVVILYILTYHKIFSVTFDERFAKSTGINTELYNMMIAMLSALTVVIGMKIMGAMLISSLIIFPPLTAMRLCKSFKSVTLISVIVALVCFVIGILVSIALDTPAGASIVLVNGLFFGLFTVISKLRTI